MTLSPSILWIIPLSVVPTLSLKSFITASFSASLTFWRITCFAACTAILPKSPSGVISTCT